MIKQRLHRFFNSLEQLRMSLAIPIKSSLFLVNVQDIIFTRERKKKERYHRRTHRAFHEGRLNAKLCTFDVLIIEEY